MTVNELNEKFEFRDIRPDEAGQAAEIERVCFPPNEACTEKMMHERVAAVPELFLVAGGEHHASWPGCAAGVPRAGTGRRDHAAV